MAKILYLKFFNDLLSDIVQHIIDPIPLCTYRLIVIAHSGLVIATRVITCVMWIKRRALKLLMIDYGYSSTFNPRIPPSMCC